MYSNPINKDRYVNLFPFFFFHITHPHMTWQAPDARNWGLPLCMTQTLKNSLTPYQGDRWLGTIIMQGETVCLKLRLKIKEFAKSV